MAQAIYPAAVLTAYRILIQ